jgi:hypothetical protein
VCSQKLHIFYSDDMMGWFLISCCTNLVMTM